MYSQRLVRTITRCDASKVQCLTIQRQVTARRRHSSLPGCDQVGIQDLKEERCDATTSTAKEQYDDSLVPPLVNGSLMALRSALKDGRFKQMLERQRRHGFRHDERTFVSLLADMPSVSTFKRVQEALDLPATPYVRNRFFRRAQQSRGLPHLIKLYGQAKREGLSRDWAVAAPVLHALTDWIAAEVTDENLDAALNVYYNAKNLDELSARSGLPSLATDTELHEYFVQSFNRLFRGLANALNKDKYFPIAQSLMQEAIAMGYKLDTIGARSTIVMLIRSAPSYEEALAVYRDFRTRERSLFDATTYAAILRTYCTLKVSKSRNTIPPVGGCLEILQTMRDDGQVILASHYAVVLKHYAEAATAIKSIPDRTTRLSHQKAFLNVAERTYDHIMTQSTVRPDIGLYSQFLDVYNRLGHFTGVVQMWNLVCAQGRIDNAAISVMFDACGFAGAYDFVWEVKRRLNADGVVMNRNNWNSWLECLCRLNRIDEAMRQLIHKSPRNPLGNPDRSSILIILSFAHRIGRLQDYRKQLQEHFQDLLKVQEQDTPFIRLLLTEVENTPTTTKPSRNRSNTQKPEINSDYFTKRPSYDPI